MSPSPDPFSSKHNKFFISLPSGIFILPFPSVSSLHDYEMYTLTSRLFLRLMKLFNVACGCFLERSGLLGLMSLCHLYFLTCWSFPAVSLNQSSYYRKHRKRRVAVHHVWRLVVTLSWEYANETYGSWSVFFDDSKIHCKWTLHLLFRLSFILATGCN